MTLTYIAQAKIFNYHKLQLAAIFIFNNICLSENKTQLKDLWMNSIYLITGNKLNTRA